MIFYCSTTGYRVVVVDNLVNSSEVSLKRVSELAKDNRTVEFHNVDLCNYSALEAIFKQYGRFDCVIHFAGLKAVGESVAKPLSYYSNNLNSSLNLFRLMEEYDSARLIFSSSATVYGDAAVPIAETSLPLAPSNPYGRTKLMIEDFLRDIGMDMMSPLVFCVYVVY
jgi:UDP-glucose 4-epimerase